MEGSNSPSLFHTVHMHVHMHMHMHTCACTCACTCTCAGRAAATGGAAAAGSWEAQITDKLTGTLVVRGTMVP